MPAPDQLPQRLRHCVDQTIAAEALEGWRPSADQVGALAALVSGDVTFADYLAAYRTRFAAEPTPETARRKYRREPPYLVPGTSLLRNKFGVNNHEVLASLEFVATAGRIAGWHRRLADGECGADDLDLRAIHRQLFADVYEWAGDYRITDLRLGDDVFARQSSVRRMMDRVEATARALVADDAESPDDTLAHQLAGLYADYNYVHPFREGNGRAGTLMLHVVAALRGRLLDLSTISRGEWYAASHDSMPLRRNGKADRTPLVPLLQRALG